jgi:hypothetical protein
MAKVTIDALDLPVLSGDSYVVRMRVVSLDENRTSYWVYFKVRKPTSIPRMV